MNPKFARHLSCLILAISALTFSLAVRVQAQEAGDFFDFPGGYKGKAPYGSLAYDTAGNLYATTRYGGDFKTVSACENFGCGEVVQLVHDGSGLDEHLLHVFSGGWDGGQPTSTPIFDAAGNLYATTTIGGNRTACAGRGCGVVFRLTPAATGFWKETVLYAFNGGADGSIPNPSLVFDSAGDLYGTTSGGISTPTCPAGCGVVFKLSPTASGPWKETVLYTFSGGTDGATPMAGLTFDSAGNLYGTTEFGGSRDYGVVYQLSLASSGRWQESVLYTFEFGTGDGYNPQSTVALDAQGNLYGTTSAGGAAKSGVVFELSPSTTLQWKETIIHQFGPGDGQFPATAGVVIDGSGNLWGNTTLGGPLGDGAVYELSPNSDGTWSEPLLVFFRGLDGAHPQNNILIDNLGFMYGTTASGGPGSYGGVYEIVP